MENESKDTESVNHTDWNLWFQQAENGDKDAVNSIIEASQPFIRSLGKNRYFRKRMSLDEINSNANYLFSVAIWKTASGIWIFRKCMNSLPNRYMQKALWQTMII